MRDMGSMKRIGRALPVLILLAALSGCGGESSSGKTVDDAMLLYQDGWFLQARRVASEHMDEPRGKLVYCLCRVFDQASQNYTEGLDGLRALYEDEGLRKNDLGAWAEAGLSYGRVIQVNQLRKKSEGSKGSQIPEKYDEVDVRGIFTEIMTGTPDTAQGSMAGLYLGETYFRSGVEGDADKGFETLEAYLTSEETAAKASGESARESAKASGKPEAELEKIEQEARRARLQHTVPLRLYLDIQYVDVRGDYASSFRHMKTAYELGIVKEVLRRTILFRMGRTCDVKLEKAKEARAYYEEFLKDYAFEKRTPLVKRYLEEMGRRGQ